jgi:phosphatidylglycerol lysyltransferase
MSLTNPLSFAPFQTKTLERNSSFFCWLANKKGTEKAFSLGFFDENYVKRTRVGVVRQDGKIVAFANLWETNSKHELSCDLTRFLDTAPQCVMEWLFIQLMLWGASQGYHFFNLGMAPLSGLETHTYAPLWYKIGHIIFEYGGEFYNFEGLRAYKNKLKIRSF